MKTNHCGQLQTKAQGGAISLHAMLFWQNALQQACVDAAAAAAQKKKNAAGASHVPKSETQVSVVRTVRMNSSFLHYSNSRFVQRDERFKRKTLHPDCSRNHLHS